MKLNRISVKNFKGFQELQLDLDGKKYCDVWYKWYW